ncbi:DUF2884 family protein [Dyella flagellata]|uniref:DUF2884 family protein n=1 Tax=Dyella flagellata TaxID=1867833 RepID=A0ABQ5XGU8_9GAMM|nr:DUF2884 family protein [Dyella flagellata]GLQ90920.1 hypothetical protein GCM10007898_44960 [Dyella flagellata]
MRRHMLSLVTLFALATAGGVQAGDIHGHHLTCSYNSDYDMQVQPQGIAFARSDGHPGDVFMHDGKLRVDGRNVTVSDEDAARLREYEREVRDLLPAVAGIARDGVDIGYSALATVVATLSENGDERTRLLHDLRDRHGEAMHHIDGTLGQGRWKAGDGSDLFGNELQDTVADTVGDITRDVLKDALSGDAGRLASLQARTESLDSTIDKAVDAPAEKLGQRAEALCPRLSHLQQLQQQFQFRLPNGERLQLIDTNMERPDKASYAQR